MFQLILSKGANIFIFISSSTVYCENDMVFIRKISKGNQTALQNQLYAFK